MKTIPNTSIKRKTMPFSKALTPSKKLKNALKECEKIESEYIPGKRKGYKNVNEMMKSIIK